MYSYALLEPGCYYLVQEKQDDALTLLQVKIVSDNCMYIVKYKDTEVSEWKKKTDTIYDIIELLSDDIVKGWIDVYYNNKDAFYSDEDE